MLASHAQRATASTWTQVRLIFFAACSYALAHCQFFFKLFFLRCINIIIFSSRCVHVSAQKRSIYTEYMQRTYDISPDRFLFLCSLSLSLHLAVNKKVKSSVFFHVSTHIYMCFGLAVLAVCWACHEGTYAHTHTQCTRNEAEDWCAVVVFEHFNIFPGIPDTQRQQQLHRIDRITCMHIERRQRKRERERRTSDREKYTYILRMQRRENRKMLLKCMRACRDGLWNIRLFIIIFVVGFAGDAVNWRLYRFFFFLSNSSFGIYIRIKYNRLIAWMFRGSRIIGRVC